MLAIQAIVPSVVNRCWDCQKIDTPNTYNCTVLQKSVKKAVNENTIDPRCPYLNIVEENAK